MRNGTIVLHKNCYLTGINSVKFTLIKVFSPVDNKYNGWIDFEKVFIFIEVHNSMLKF